MQEKEPDLALQVLAQKRDEELGQFLGGVLAAQGVVQAGLALAQPVHLAQVAGHAVQGLGQHAQFVILAQIQAGFEVPGGDGFREVHALLQGVADAAGQPIGAGGDHDDQHRSGDADDQQKGPDGAEHFALVDLGDENPIGAQNVQGVEGHEHGRARAVRVGAAATVEALGHRVVPIGGGAAEGVPDDIEALAQGFYVAAQLEFFLVLVPAQQVGFPGIAQPLARGHDLVDEFRRDLGRDDSGHVALQVQNRIADKGCLTSAVRFIDGEVLEDHVAGAQYPLPEPGQRGVPIAPGGDAGAQFLALPGGIHDMTVDAVQQIEVREAVDRDVTFELGVVSSVDSLIFACADWVGLLRIFVSESVQIVHGLLGLTQACQEFQSVDAFGQGGLKLVALDVLDAAELIEGQIQQGGGRGVAADEGHDAQRNNPGHDEQEEQLGLHADVVKNHGSSWLSDCEVARKTPKSGILHRKHRVALMSIQRQGQRVCQTNCVIHFRGVSFCGRAGLAFRLMRA